MKLATYVHEGTEHAGVVVEELVHPLTATVAELVAVGLPAALAVGAEAVAGTAGIPLAQVRLLAPLQPPTVRDFVAFEEHVEGVRASIDGAEGAPDAWYAAPTFYFTNPYAIIATGDEVPVPPGPSSSTSSWRWPR